MFSTKYHAFPQLANKLCQNHNPHSLLTIATQTSGFGQIQTANMFAKHCIAARNFCNSSNKKGRNCWQFRFQNYTVASCNHVERTSLTLKSAEKSPTTMLEDRRLEDSSHINTRNHIYYEKYSIPGFNPIVYTLPKQADPSMEISTMDVQKREVVVEDICYSPACNVNCKKRSIVAFKSNDAVLVGWDKVAEKGSAMGIRSPIEKVDDDMDPYDHAYYKNYSIAGFGRIQTPILAPTHSKLTNTPTNQTLNMSKAKALSIAAAYVPSCCVQKNMDQKYSDIDHDIDTCARTIESLEWEILGIID